MTVLNGLIIKDPYLSYILDGTKTWEMRSTSTKQRGLVTLIKNRTGKVWGLAELVDVRGPLSMNDMLTFH